MSSFAEYTRKKKKEEQKNGGTSFSDYTRMVLGDDIAPISTNPVRSGYIHTQGYRDAMKKILEKEEEEKEEKTVLGGGGYSRGGEEIAPTKERTWFEKGAFDDEEEGSFLSKLRKSNRATGVDLAENISTGILGMGEKFVDFLAWMAPALTTYQASQATINYNFDIEEYARMQEESAKFIKKDLYDEEEIAKTIITNPAKKIGINAETQSFMGEKSDALAQSAGQLGATVGLQAVGVPWWLTTGTTSFGGEAENALKEGATYEQAGGSALITAGADILTEKLSGGIKFGGKTLDDVMLKPLTEKIANKTVRTLTNVGIDAFGEGSEEVIASVISNLGTSLYKEENIEELLTSEEALDEYIESFIGGAVLGGGVSAITSVKSNNASDNTQEDVLTENEQKVVDKVLETRIEEAETDGKKLTKADKAKLEEEVKTELQKGYIDIDTIEGVLGGETYNTYNSIVEQENTLREEIERLQSDPRPTAQSRLVEAKAELEAIEKGTEKTELKDRLSLEVQELTKGDLLSESYNEKARRSQVFEADLSKYDAKAQETVKKAVESGILNNTNKTHDFVDMIAKLSAEKGVLFDFTNNENLKKSGFALEGKTVNGLVSGSDVVLNIDSDKALNTVVGHEITHVLEGSDLYTELQSAVIEYSKTKGEYDSRLQAIKQLYKGVENANIDNELTADLVGDYLFTDADFINSLSTTKPNVFKKIYEEIKYLYKLATAGSKEARQLEKVKRTFDKVYKESKAKATTEADVKLSIDEDVDSEIENLIDEEIDWDELLGTKWISKLGYKVSESPTTETKGDNPRYNADTTKKGKVAKLTNERIERLFREYGASNPNYAQAYITSIHPRDFLSLTLNDGTLEQWDVASKDGSNAELYPLDVDKLKNQTQTPFLIVDSETGRVDGHEGRHRMRALLEAGVTEVPIAVIDLKTKYSKQKESSLDISSQEYSKGFVNDNFTTQIKNLIPLNAVYREDIMSTYGGEGDIKFSLSEDSEGNSVSPAVQKRFEKSKAVDENGSLKVLYHGTPSGEFTIFDKSKGSVEGDFGSGFYFTDNEADVETNYEGGGPDFENKVARRAEQIEAEEDIDYDEAEQRAREELYKGSNKFEVYLNIENPAIVGKTTLLSQEDYLEQYSEEDYDDYDEYIADVEQLVADDIENIVWEVEQNVDLYSTDGIAEVLYDAYYEGGIGIEDLKARINELYLEDNEGNLAGNEVTRQIIESLGYDGIIDSTVSSKFKNMGIEEGTTHYIVFKPNQIKSITNQNPTDNPDINLSLSDKKQNIAPTGKYNVYGKDIGLEAPTQPVQQTVVDEYAPLTEAEANERDAMQSDRLYSLNEEDMPEEVEAPIYEETAEEAESPFDEKDIQEVGNRKQKAYMYENPEVKPYFQEEARIMLGELRNSVKGEKHYNDQLYYDSNGEQGWFGTKRETSEQIAYMLDRFKYTYADIEKGLNAIIEDHGAENNAISKRLEFMLDERLREGYTDFLSGMDIPSNQDYINLLNEKQISEYTDEAYNRYLESLAYAEAPEHFVDTNKMVEDIAPTRDIEVSEGTQRRIDLETGEIVDEAETPERKTHGEIQRAYVDNIKQKFTEAGMDFDKILENAIDKSTFASVDNTPQRYIEKTIGYKEGQILNDLTINQEALNESKAIKWLNSFTDRKSGELARLSKKYGIKPNSKEDASAQMYAEGFYVNDNNEFIRYGDAELAKDFPNVETQRRIKALVNNPRIREIYDNTLKEINESRVRNGYPEIPRRDNYYLHFRAMDDTFSRLGIPFNPNDIRAKDLPTDINGMTADLKPGQPYFASANQRKGLRTSHSLLGGMERYLTSAKNQIYHIDDIQTLRGLRNYVADMYGQAHGLENLDTLTEEEAEARVKEVYDAHLSTFAKFLNEQANVLAGKTSLIDRGLEGVIGRRGIQTLNTINSQVAKNMVGFNVSSALTGFTSAVQGFAKANKYDAVKAFTQVASNRMKSIFGKSDGFAENDPTMIRRRGAEKFYRTPYEKVSDLGYTLMSGVDNLSTEFIIRAKYNELTRKGMDSEKAQIEAGKWAMRILGDRSLGQQPQLYNSKMLGLVTKFQLEVRNQLDSMVYDTIQEEKLNNEDINNRLAKNSKTAVKVASTMVQLAVFQHLFGKAFESVAGYNPTFDIISTLMTLFGFDDDEESEDTFLDNAEQALLELLEDLPYTSTFTGGRIPIQSALPIEQLIKGEDNYGNDKSRWETLSETAPYYIMPGGYNQIKKSVQGMGMFSEEHPVSGSYTDSGNLRFPVEDTLKNRIQAGIFGQWASENARDYFDNERKPLKEKQIEEFAELDIPIKDYWKYREGLNEQEDLEDKFDYIAGLDLPVEKKNIMINNIVDRKEDVDLTNYDDFSNYEEFDFATKNPEKYEFLQSINVSYEDYNKSDEAKEAYNWAYKNPEKYVVSKAIGDVVEYKRYTRVLGDITADKDENGKTISGSRKEKVANYINGLEADYGEKIILFKSEYPADDTYNQDIIDYLNNREDISYSEMEVILKELGFTVDTDGSIYW